MFELRRYRGDAELSGLARSPAVSSLLSILNQQGWAIDMAAVDPDGDLVILCERPDGTDESGVAGTDSLRLVDRVVLRDVQLVRRPEGPGLVAPDGDLRNPRPTSWQTAEVAPHRTTVVVRFGRGMHEGLHSVQVVETASRVAITINLGVWPKFTEGTHVIPAVLIIEQTIIELSEPLGERAVVDGAA